MKGRIAAATLAFVLALGAVGAPRHVSAEGELGRLNMALVWGLAGGSMGYYSQKMNYSFFHRIVPARFSPMEAGVLMGSWFVFLSYTGYGAAALRGSALGPHSASDTAFAGSLELPTAMPLLGIDDRGHAIVGATVQF